MTNIIMISKSSNLINQK